MGFWTDLAKIGGDVVGGGAGDLISTIGKVADVAAPIISHSGQTSAQNRQTKYAQDLEAQKYQDALDRTRLAGEIAKSNSANEAITSAIAEQKAQDAARSAANSAAVRGALQKHIQDVSFNRGNLSSTVPNMSFSGGLRPSAFGPELAQAGTSLNASGQNELDHPPSFPKVPEPIDFTPTNTKIPEAPDETIWEKMAGPVSFGLTVAGEAMKNHQPSSTASPTNVPTGGATTTGEVNIGDIMRWLAAVKAHQAPTPAQTDPTLGQNVSFGPGVLPAPPTLGSGVTFGGGNG